MAQPSVELDVADPIAGDVIPFPVNQKITDVTRAETSMQVGNIIESEVDSPEAREKIDKLLAIMLAAEQVEIPLTHFFAKGVYARQGIIKKGTIIVGHYKKWSHINIISSGDISIFTEQGDRRITGPATMVAAPGTRRVGYAHEDTIWTTIVGTNDTTVEDVEENFLAKTYEDYLVFCGRAISERKQSCLE